MKYEARVSQTETCWCDYIVYVEASSEAEAREKILAGEWADAIIKNQETGDVSATLIDEGPEPVEDKS